MCLSEFNKARNDESIARPENNVDFETEELKLFELRNACVSRADKFYSNAHFSSAIKECQELTDELRVSSICIQIERLFCLIIFFVLILFCWHLITMGGAYNR